MLVDDVFDGEEEHNNDFTKGGLHLNNVDVEQVQFIREKDGGNWDGKRIVLVRGSSQELLALKKCILEYGAVTQSGEKRRVTRPLKDTAIGLYHGEGDNLHELKDINKTRTGIESFCILR